MPRPARDTRTLDLLSWQPPELEQRFPVEVTRAASFKSALSRAISAALRDCDLSREDVASRMSEYLGEDVSKAALDACASEARTDHVINTCRFLALIHATGDRRLLQLLADQFGLAVIEPKYLKIVRAQQARDEAERLQKVAAQLMAEANR